MAPPTKLQTGSQFLTKDFLRFGMVDIRWGGSRLSTRRMHLTGHGGGRRTAPGDSAGVKLLAAWAGRAGEGTKRRPNRVCAFVENLKTGTARNAGHTPYGAAGSLSSVDGESTDTCERGKPSVAGTLWVLPTHASDICLQRPSLPTARLNKRTQTRDHLRPPVSGWKLDTEETGKQRSKNRGNHFRRDQCNRLKSL